MKHLDKKELNTQEMTLLELKQADGGNLLGIIRGFSKIKITDQKLYNAIDLAQQAYGIYDKVQKIDTTSMSTSFKPMLITDILKNS